MIPRSFLVAVLAVLVAVLVADVAGVFVIPGHDASPIVSGGVLTILGGVFAASRGPKPPTPPDDAEPPPDSARTGTAPDTASGRHRSEESP